MSYAIYCVEHKATDSEFIPPKQVWADQLDAELAALQQTEYNHSKGLDCTFVVRDTSTPAVLGPREFVTMLVHGTNIFAEDAPLWQAEPGIPERARDIFQRVLGKRGYLLSNKDGEELAGLATTLEEAVVAWVDKAV